MIQKLDKWHKTKLGLLFFALVELMIAYGFMSLSIDRGNFFWYLLALVFLVGSLHNFVKLFGALARGR
jgi:hypothetical protein